MTFGLGPLAPSAFPFQGIGLEAPSQMDHAFPHFPSHHLLLF